MKQKKFLSLALVLAMMLSLLSVTALARDFTPPLTVTGTENEDYKWLPADNMNNEMGVDTLYILKDGVTVSGGTADEPANVIIVIGDIEGAGEATNLTLDDVHIKSANPLDGNLCRDDFTLNIADTNSLYYYYYDEEDGISDKSGPAIMFDYSNIKVSGDGTLNVYGSVCCGSDDNPTSLVFDGCTVNTDAFNMPGIYANYAALELTNGANLTATVSPHETEEVLSGITYTTVSLSPAVMAASLTIEEGCSLLLRGEYSYKNTVDGEIENDMLCGGAIVLCCEEAPTITGLLGSVDINAKIQDINLEVTFAYEEDMEWYSCKVSDELARAVKFGDIKQEDDDPEEKPTVTFDFDGLFNTILRLIGWKKVTDDVKAVSILTIILNFITRIIEIIRGKLN